MNNLKKINWKRLLLDNWVLKLASLIVAFTLWLVVFTVNDPIEKGSFVNIKVNLLNTEEITDLGKVYEVLDNTDVIKKVTFEAPDSVLEEIREEDIVAEADVNTISEINTVAIRLTCPKYSDSVTDLKGSINNVKLNIEDKLSKNIDIVWNCIGEVAEGYKLGKINLGANRLEIKGPKSKVEQIAKAVVDINIEDINEDIYTQINVSLLDKEGKPVSYDSVEQSIKSTSVRVNVLTIKEIPVLYEPVGEVAEGYLATGVVEGIPQTIKIAGTQTAVDSMSEIVISDELDLTDMEGNLEKTIDLEKYLKSGIEFADDTFDGKAEVIVYVEEEMAKMLRLRSSNLKVTGAPEGILAEVIIDQEMPFLEVKGLNKDLEPLRESTLTGTIDVAAWMEENQIEELTYGIRYLPVVFQLAEGQNAMNEVSVQVQFIVLKEKEFLE